jgi:diguanylate cyclase (GGDEF)-like protein
MRSAASFPAGMLARFGARSLQRRFLLALVLCAVTIGTLSSVAAFRLGYAQTVTAERASLQSLLIAVENTVAVGLYASDTLLVREVITGLCSSPMAAKVTLINRDGITVDRLACLDFADQPGAAVSVSQTLRSPFDVAETLGTLQLQANQDRIVQKATAEAVRLSVMLGALIVVLMLLVGFLVRALVSKPIAALAHALRRMTPGGANRLAPMAWHAHDEIGDLIAGSNELLDNNQRALERERSLRQEMEKLETQYRSLFQFSSAGMLVIQTESPPRLLHCNATARRLLSLPDNSDTQKLFQALLGALAQPDKLTDLTQEARRSGYTAQADLQLRPGHSSTRWVHALLTVNPQRSGQDSPPRAAASDQVGLADAGVSGQALGSVVELVLYDVTLRKSIEQTQRQRAETDALTQLANRAHAEAALDRLMQFGGRGTDPFSVICIDLDGFKQINDSLGHRGGDEVLVQCAQRMRQALRRGTDFCARTGGDEFLVVLPHTKAHDPHLCEVAQNLLRALREPMVLQDQVVVTVGASLGLASYPLHGRDRQTLLHLADLALYEVKRTGRHGFAMAWAPGLRGL